MTADTAPVPAALCTPVRLAAGSLRFIYLLMIEELARHAGDGDILAEQINRPINP